MIFKLDTVFKTFKVFSLKSFYKVYPVTLKKNVKIINFVHIRIHLDLRHLEK